MCKNDVVARLVSTFRSVGIRTAGCKQPVSPAQQPAAEELKRVFIARDAPRGFPHFDMGRRAGIYVRVLPSATVHRGWPGHIGCAMTKSMPSAWISATRAAIISPSLIRQSTCLSVPSARPWPINVVNSTPPKISVLPWFEVGRSARPEIALRLVGNAESSPRRFASAVNCSTLRRASEWREWPWRSPRNQPGQDLLLAPAPAMAYRAHRAHPNSTPLRSGIGRDRAPEFDARRSRRSGVRSRQVSAVSRAMRSLRKEPRIDRHCCGACRERRPGHRQRCLAGAGFRLRAVKRVEFEVNAQRPDAFGYIEFMRHMPSKIVEGEHAFEYAALFPVGSRHVAL